MGGKSGLSLFETLVSLALLSFLAVGLSASLGLGVRTLDRVRASANLSQELALRAQLRNWLATATPPQRLTRIETRLVGQPGRLEFVTFAPTGFSPEAAALSVIVEIEAGLISMTLEALDDGGTPIENSRRALASGVVNGQISYYDATAIPPSWRSEWGEANRIPSLVRIEADNGSEPEWTEFTVRLQYADGS
ncbi:MAG: hypothetical protein ABJR46_16605 [Tateyamaria sp.]|uniref:hypothetical protein n=1 Tax=Tateyamaria sp. TaxID=1929288 RepID=UPI00329D45E6